MTRVAGYPPTRDHWLETGRTGPNLTYRIMFLTGVDFDAYPELRRASLESFGVLEAAVREFQLSAPLDHEKDLAFAAQALVHGIASLLSEDRLIPEVARSREVSELAHVTARLLVSEKRQAATNMNLPRLLTVELGGKQLALGRARPAAVALLQTRRE